MWEDMPNTTTWYRFIETRCQKWVVFDGKQVPKRDTVLGLCYAKLKTQEPW